MTIIIIMVCILLIMLLLFVLVINIITIIMLLFNYLSCDNDYSYFIRRCPDAAAAAGTEI